LDDERKCFRLIGGVLVERKICDVLPTLIKNRGEVSFIYIYNIGVRRGYAAAYPE